MTILPQWQEIINQEQSKTYFKELTKAIEEQRNNGEIIYPKQEDVFNAFSYTDLANVKVVILGQDPYHGCNEQGTPQAHGLAFSVAHGFKVPPSLVNMYKELATDIEDFNTPNHGNLSAWAKQGVLLLNTVLTVKKANAHSHAKLGWETFTEKVIEEISLHNKGCVFILWGSHAQKKGKHIDSIEKGGKHLVLQGPHPSPLSAYRGFFGCKHFSQANSWLIENNHSPIDWKIA